MAFVLIVGLSISGAFAAMQCAAKDDACMSNSTDVAALRVGARGMALMQKRAVKSTRQSLMPTAQATPDDTLPKLATFAFSRAEGASFAFMESGNERTLPARSATECANNVKDADTLGDLALVTMKYGANCYPWPGYSHGDYPVTKGTLTIEGTAAAAYEVHPPNSPATAFVAGGTGIYYRFSEKRGYKVYALEDNALVQVGEVTADAIVVGQYVYVGVKVDGLGAATVYVFLPAETRIPPPGSRTILGSEASECDLSGIVAGS
eukprot:CAMPEP_0117567802 /NCGR_PEP_ID=MMETSP0784-20121206/57797_1 /TAXON_ID=39447 /ORGANISM="" /LENGTH=263 /DNA_ID=CAMNT_0005365689 /DNA_START=56 /DNA_END=843 /DNA_ORIENTATION=-